MTYRLATIHQWQKTTDGRTDGRTTTVSIVRPLHKYGGLKIKNRMGPMTEPWGTPLQTFFQLEQQESLANAKGNARQQCMFESPLWTRSKAHRQQQLTIYSHRPTPDGATVSRGFCCLNGRMRVFWRMYPSLTPSYKEFLERRGGGGEI